MDEDEAGVEVEETDEDNDDIYGDLDADIFGPSPTKKLKNDEIAISSEQYQALITENQELKALVGKLKQDNKKYLNNINSLFETARNEVDKKNFIIKTLSDKWKRYINSKSTLSNAEAEEILQKCQEALVESQHAVTIEEIRKNLKTVMDEHPKLALGKKKRRRKHFKFGNMSYYFFSEQAPIQREEEVTFPKNSDNVQRAKDESNKSESSAPHNDSSKNGESHNNCDNDRDVGRSHNNYRDSGGPEEKVKVRRSRSKSRSWSPPARRRSHDRDRETKSSHHHRDRDRTRSNRSRSRSNDRQTKRRRIENPGGSQDRHENRRDDHSSHRKNSNSRSNDRDTASAKEIKSRSSRDHIDEKDVRSTRRSARTSTSDTNLRHNNNNTDSSKRSMRNNR